MPDRLWEQLHVSSLQPAVGAPQDARAGTFRLAQVNEAGVGVGFGVGSAFGVAAGAGVGVGAGVAAGVGAGAAIGVSAGAGAVACVMAGVMVGVVGDEPPPPHACKNATDTTSATLLANVI